jgi:hypothetical protein
MFSGVKTNYETVGFDNSIVNDDPYSELSARDRFNETSFRTKKLLDKFLSFNNSLSVILKL